jgi:tRNA(Ile)-lysidine synthase
MLGFSGGTDSACLFHILLSLHKKGAITLSTAHFNHQWRSISDHEAKACAQLAHENQLQHIEGNASQKEFTPPHQSGSAEDHARIMRHQFFKYAQKKLSADAIALAHHADDQYETFFIRLARGSGLAGLCGMSERQGPIIRPLLSVRRSQIEHYLETHSIPFFVDQTNYDGANLRAKIRTTLTPALNATDPRIIPNTLRTIENLSNTQSTLHFLLDSEIKSLFDNKGKASRKRFLSYELPVQKTILAHWIAHYTSETELSTNRINEIIRFIEHENGGRHRITPTLTIVKKQGLFWAE